MVVQLTVEELCEIVRGEIEAARKPAKALYTTKEAAEILNVDESWLSAKARKGKIPHRMLGTTVIFPWLTYRRSLTVAMYRVYSRSMTGKELRRIRKRLRLSQAKLAMALETTVTSVARWERGEVPISGPVSVCLGSFVEKKERGEKKEMIRQTKAGTWEVDHYYFDPDGKRRRKLRTFAKHKDAVAYEKEALAQVQKREFVPPTKVTVKERATGWLEARFANGNYERSTRIERESHVNHYIAPAFGAMPIQNLTIELIERQMVEWNKKVSAKTVNKVVRTLTEIMSEAKRHAVIRDNPAAEAKRLKQEVEEITPDKVFTRDELRRVIGATEPGTRERVAVTILALTGCRIGELLGRAGTR